MQSCDKKRKIQYDIPQLPLDIYKLIAQKIDYIDTLINYLNTCKILYQIPILSIVHNIKFVLSDELSKQRTYKTYLEYLLSYRFIIHIPFFKSFWVFGLVSNIPIDLLKKMSFDFICTTDHYISVRGLDMRIVDRGTFRNIIFDNPKYECKCVELWLGVSKTTALYGMINFDHDSEFLLGRNAIYENINTNNILHTASTKWIIGLDEYVISFYTGFPRLEY